MTKAEFRELLKSQRQKLSAQQVAAKSKAICSRVIAALDWQQIRSAHCYNPIITSNEVDTTGLQNWMRRRGIYIKNPGSELTLEEMTYRFDLIIVPMLGFDRRLHRLGYGRGFYDRLLEAQTKSMSVGLSYDDCLVEVGLPIEPHDQALDMVVSETTIFKVNNDLFE